MDGAHAVRALARGSGEQLQGSEGASQAKFGLEGQEGFAGGAADRGAPGGVTVGAKVGVGGVWHL